MDDASWISLVASLLAFGTAIWSNKIAREAIRHGGTQRIAEFRKEWIEELRRNVAEFLMAEAQSRVLKNKMELMGGLPGTSEFTLSKAMQFHDAHLEAEARAARSLETILLSLNPNEPAHKELLGSLKPVWESRDDRKISHTEIIELTRKVLKTEWDRLTDEIMKGKVK